MPEPCCNRSFMMAKFLFSLRQHLGCCNFLDFVPSQLMGQEELGNDAVGGDIALAPHVYT